MRITVSVTHEAPSIFSTARDSSVLYLPHCCHPQQTSTGDSFTFLSEDGQVIEEVVGPAGLTGSIGIATTLLLGRPPGTAPRRAGGHALSSRLSRAHIFVLLSKSLAPPAESCWRIRSRWLPLKSSNSSTRSTPFLQNFLAVSTA